MRNKQATIINLQKEIDHLEAQLRKHPKKLYNEAEEDELKHIKDQLRHARERLAFLEEEVNRLHKDLRKKQDDLLDAQDEYERLRRALLLAEKGRLDENELTRFRKKNSDLEKTIADMERLLEEMKGRLKGK